jgi:hypothetical protein
MFLPVPYKVQRIIATDLNRLSVDATVALKCASVLCMGGGQTYVEFDIGMLAVIYPHDGGRAMTSKDLEPHLDTLVQVCHSCFPPGSRGIDFLGGFSYRCDSSLLALTVCDDSNWYTRCSIEYKVRIVLCVVF